ncbi:hypothetical protein CLU79DRAFT_713157, partial [Phycomyces nitens]
YDVCPKGCKLYNLDDAQVECAACGEQRYKPNNSIVKVPIAQMKLLSIGDIISKMLADRDTRELLQYRANRESRAGEINDIFDGKNYKELVRQGMFANPDDIALGIYTDGFVNQKKGKASYTVGGKRVRMFY